MQRIVLVLILAIVGVALYLFLDQPQNTPAPPAGSEQAGAPQVEQPQPSATQTLLAQPVSEETRVEAKAHIEQLTTQSSEAVLDISQADNFVTGEQLLTMPTMAAEQVSIETVNVGALNDAAPSAASAATAAQPVITPAQDQQAPASQVVVTQGVDLGLTLSRPSGSDNQIITVDYGSNPQNTLTVTRSLRPGQQIRLQELLSDPDIAAGSIFYIHAVSEADEQGLWGILQRGLTETFSRGVQLKTSGRLLSVDIPEMADETLENRRSSFLGNFLYEKVQNTYVYNYHQGMLGQDPNLIKPGQQLIIVSYTEDELIAIFNHFAQNANNGG